MATATVDCRRVQVSLMSHDGAIFDEGCFCSRIQSVIGAGKLPLSDIPCPATGSQSKLRSRVQGGSHQLEPAQLT
jgi:hypothetical protein